MPPQENNVPSQNPPEDAHQGISILKRNIKYAFLLVLTFLLVVTGAFSIWYFSNPEPEEETDMSASLPPTDQFADWKTYRNEEYGFEFKYPEDWKFEADERGVYLNSPKNKECELCRLDIVIAFDKNTKNFEAKNYYNEIETVLNQILSTFKFIK